MFRGCVFADVLSSSNHTLASKQAQPQPSDKHEIGSLTLDSFFIKPPFYTCIKPPFYRTRHRTLPEMLKIKL
jgi:hypothetical protein